MIPFNITIVAYQCNKLLYSKTYLAQKKYDWNIDKNATLINTEKVKMHIIKRLLSNKIFYIRSNIY